MALTFAIASREHWGGVVRVRQSRPDSGRGLSHFQANVLKPLSGILFSLSSGLIVSLALNDRFG